MSSVAVVAIVGGGASGCLTAAQVARQAAAAGRRVDILLIEPNETGQGLAYSTTDPRHRLNVPAKGMSALPDDPAHFLAWMRRHVHVDFPEGGLGQRAWLNVHCLDEPARQCVHRETDARLSDWHTYTIEWVPGRITYLVDGQAIGSTTNSVPTKPLHWVMQVATTGERPDPGTAGHLLIDWATVDRYTG